MRRMWLWGVLVGALAMVPSVGHAVEHGGKEHGGLPAGQAGTTQEHAGAPVVQQVEPTAEQIRQAIRDYIQVVEQEEGAFTILDEIAGVERTLELVRVHERVGKTGDYYYSCTDMNDVSSGELLDLDFDVEASGGELSVVDVRIHKLDGKPRYTYDEQDHRIPLM